MEANQPRSKKPCNAEPSNSAEKSFVPLAWLSAMSIRPWLPFQGWIVRGRTIKRIEEIERHSRYVQADRAETEEGA